MAAFRGWKRENGFDNASAARTLGVPMARVADWSPGRESPPPEVAAACYAYTHGWRPSLETAPTPRRKRRTAALEQIRAALRLPEEASTERITQAAARASEPSLKDRTEALAARILGGRPVPGNGGQDVRVDGPGSRHVLVEIKSRTVSAPTGPGISRRASAKTGASVTTSSCWSASGTRRPSARTTARAAATHCPCSPTPTPSG